MALEGVDIEPLKFPSIHKWKSTMKVYSTSDMQRSVLLLLGGRVGGQGRGLARLKNCKLAVLSLFLSVFLSFFLSFSLSSEDTLQDLYPPFPAISARATTNNYFFVDESIN